LQFVKASAATLSQQEKNDTVNVQRGRVHIRLYRYSGKLSLAPLHLRRARVVGRNFVAGAQPLTHVCTAGACGKKITAWEIVKQNFKFSWARLFQKSGSSPPPVTTRTQNLRSA
jgi:hypothetical protein